MVEGLWNVDKFLTWTDHTLIHSTNIYWELLYMQSTILEAGDIRVNDTSSFLSGNTYFLLEVNSKHIYDTPGSNDELWRKLAQD